MRYLTRCMIYAGLFFCLACNKDVLDRKPVISLVVPATIQDFQALLENTTFVWNTDDKGMMEVLCGDHRVNFNDVQSASQALRNAYTWQSNVYGQEINDPDWNNGYRKIYNANVVLDGLAAMDKSLQGSAAWNNTKGVALFFRANAFMILSQLYAKPYQAATAMQEQGIPLRLSADFNIPTKRASLEETYRQIRNDLLTAAELLPPDQPYKTQPGKAAAYGLLARLNILMQDYDNALVNADKSLMLAPELLDFNTLDTTARFPVADMNVEVLFRRTLTNYGVLFSTGVCKMDQDLIGMYQPDDLRKPVFYVKNTDGTFSFRGHYTGTAVPFGGVATDEVYLIKAEALARDNQVPLAMQTLNDLLVTRWKKGHFIPLEVQTKEEALDIILKERRKELAFRGIRWTDLRRLNLDPAYASTIKRSIDGTEYVLPPNDPRYVQLIHQNIIDMTGIPQNLR